MGTIDAELKQLAQQAAAASDDIQAIYQATSALADIKQAQLAARLVLDGLRDANLATLATIAKLTVRSVKPSFVACCLGLWCRCVIHTCS